MAKSERGADAPATFEEALEELEAITRRLEDGELGLGESLECYERGISLLKECHRKLRAAEQKISLLTEIGPDGTAVTEPFDEEDMSLEEKQETRGRRRSQPARTPPPDSDESDMDIQKGLF